MKPIRFQFTQEPLASPQSKQWGANYPEPALHTQTKPQLLFTLIEKPLFYEGFMNGFRQPVALVKIQTAPECIELGPLQQAFSYYFNKHFQGACSQTISDYLGEGVCALQKAAGFPLLESIQVEKLSAKDSVYALWIPALLEEVFHQALAFTLQFCYQHLAQAHFVPNAGLKLEIEELTARLNHFAPRGSNSLRLIQAAQQLDIPWLHLAQHTYQFGYGCHSRWFDSTFTDKTSTLSARLANEKHCTWQLWKKAGLPVPEQVKIQSLPHVIKQAQTLGYPVVLKPSNHEGGHGVFAHITSEEKLITAYQALQQISKSILMEKHIKGKDYRLLMLNGELIWAIERIPAGVTGDGIHTIQVLIDKTNQQPNRGLGQSSALKRIEICQSMIDFLAEQHYNLESIPHEGQFIALSRTANISVGGTPVAVFDKVHPDNKKMVETAAKLLRLDFAGVDFICPNIEESYLKVGGALIEINAQPQLGIITTGHIHRQVLSALIPNKGRIPIIVICGEPAQDLQFQKLIITLMRDYRNVGLVKNKEAFINNELMCQAPSLFNAANALLLNNQLELLVYCIQDAKDLDFQGLPFDAYDYLIVLNELPILPMLMKACKGNDHSDSPWMTLIKEWLGLME